MAAASGRRDKGSAHSARRGRRSALMIGALAGIGAGAALVAGLQSHEERSDERRPETLAERTGTLFGPAPKNLEAPPVVERVILPTLETPKPIWGATGRDLDGVIWIGMTHGPDRMGAHLMGYDPRARAWRTAGSVGDQLRRLGISRDGETQRKIHSKIVLADDGWLYFASTDEEGEKDDGSALPKWGAHLWRMKPGNERWEHLMGVPEGIVAVSAAARHVYALGYWGHVLFQYDTESGKVRRVVVGSVGGHVSHNFVASVHGHAYVPRVTRLPDGRVKTLLVEFDAELREIGSTELEHYLPATGNPDDHHGITGFCTLPDGRMAFTTSRGQLYLITPNRAGPASVAAMGWFNPAGESYAPSLFSYGGNNLVAGATLRGDQYEWVLFELVAGFARKFPLDLKGTRKALLFGSQTRDDDGACYLVGWSNEGMGANEPLVLRVTPAA